MAMFCIMAKAQRCGEADNDERDIRGDQRFGNTEWIGGL